MNRRQKIIVSVTGIFIVLLILIGLTYAYFLTRIQGNTNNKSISVSTAKLELIYGDGTGEIITEDKIIPGTEIGSKTFTVTNNGDKKVSYLVILENIVVKKTSDNTTTTFESNDFIYTLTCTSNCNGVENGILPLRDGILISNEIETGETQTYTMTVTYKDTGINQSNDMGKSLSARVNIIDFSTYNPYSDNKSSLAYNIINNAALKKNGTELLSSPRSIVAEEISEYATGKKTKETVSTSSLCASYYPWLIGDTASAAQSGSSVSSYEEAIGKYVYDQCSSWTKKLLSYDSSTNTLTFDNEVDEILPEKTLSIAEDDLGTSYYYRGNVEDNYVNFAGMCWRIVRIEGDGSVKLILEDQDQECQPRKTDENPTGMDGNWNIPTTTGGTTTTGNYGYTEYAANTLTASDGTTKNSSTRYLMDYLHGETNSDKSMATAFKNFQSTFTETELSKLKSGNWCLGDKGYATTNDNTTPLTEQEMLDKKVKGTTFYYDSYVRLNGKTPKEPTLKCNGTVMKKFGDNTTDMYVGALTADEIVYAGGKFGTSNQNYYLTNANSLSFWFLSPNRFYSTYDLAFSVDLAGSLGFGNVNGDFFAFRPAVSLSSSAVITGGEGTLKKPYIID